MGAPDRAALIGSTLKGRSLRYTYRGLDFELSGVTVNGPAVTVTVAASDTRGPLPVDNPYTFVNPPGSTIADAREMIHETVVLVATRAGWTP